MTNACPTTWGATVLRDGRARFRLWAPDEQTLKLRTDAGDLAMERQADGWFEIVTDAVPVGGGYAFVLDDGFVVPDPAARAQMGDVHGPSKLVDPDAYEWKTEWAGRPWRECVIYEMHVGTFTPEGTFRAAIEKLPHLAAIARIMRDREQFAPVGADRHAPLNCSSCASTAIAITSGSLPATPGTPIGAVRRSSAASPIPSAFSREVKRAILVSEPISPTNPVWSRRSAASVSS